LSEVATPAKDPEGDSQDSHKLFEVFGTRADVLDELCREAGDDLKAVKLKKFACRAAKGFSSGHMQETYLDGIATLVSRVAIAGGLR
jgi:hypothetical protein